MMMIHKTPQSVPLFFLYANAPFFTQGDEGGPLVLRACDNRYVIVGILSYGLSCGDPTKIDVYTDVTAFLQWISDNDGGSAC